MGESIKLNLGCGTKHWEGFVNVDFPNMNPDVEADLRVLPFKDNYADEAHAIHVIEHFYVWEVEDVLKEWKRVLKPGGKLVLELPDLNKALYWFSQNPVYPQMTFWALYGDPGHKNPNMCHRWAYTAEMITTLLKDAGFRDIKEAKPLFHVEQRDMRLEAYK